MSQEASIRVIRDSMNRLRGRMFQAVEAAGLPIKQENALKRLIRQSTYDAQADLEQAVREESYAG